MIRFLGWTFLLLIIGCFFVWMRSTGKRSNELVTPVPTGPSQHFIKMQRNAQGYLVDVEDAAISK